MEIDVRYLVYNTEMTRQRLIFLMGENAWPRQVKTAGELGYRNPERYLESWLMFTHYYRYPLAPPLPKNPCYTRITFSVCMKDLGRITSDDLVDNTNLPEKWSIPCVALSKAKSL